jgi:hypothetical protein
MKSADASRPQRRAVWGDTRFLLGILLVVVSIVGVWFVISSARQTAPVWAAERTLVPGEVISRDDLAIVEVALGQSGGAYLALDDFTDGVVATRTVTAGELLPVDAVADADSVRTANVVVRSSADVAASIEPGTTVELWSAPLLERGTYDTPRILVADATVAAVTRDDSAIAGGGAALELVIPRSEVAETLAAIADQAALSVVGAGAGS